MKPKFKRLCVIPLVACTIFTMSCVNRHATPATANTATIQNSQNSQNSTNINALPSTSPEVSQKIALLLPLAGPLATQAQAIRNGFFAAYYQAKTTGPIPQIMVFNTEGQNIITVYRQAVEKGATFIVGPLPKNDLLTLVKSNKISIPTLALNTLPFYDLGVSHLFQFGLSPIDEAVQAAQKMKNDEHHQILLITPAGSWGEMITQAFQAEWQSSDGTIIAQLTYDKSTHLNQAIQNLLNIDESTKRAHALQQLLQEKLRYIPRRRQDFDAIFLVANSSEAKQIVPLLRFNYAGNAPIYATSSIYTPFSGSNSDINGVIFNDMPWILKPKQLAPALQEIRQHIQTLWPNSYKRNPRLYALGVDAFNLITILKNLSLENGMAEATGTLYLLKNGHIYRELMWGQVNSRINVSLNSTNLP